MTEVESVSQLMVWLTHGSGGLLAVDARGLGCRCFWSWHRSCRYVGRRFFVDLWMYHKPWLLALGAAVSTLARGFIAAVAAESPPKLAPPVRRPPSLLIIAVDSLRADRLFEDRRGEWSRRR
jgi:hypothetical protein